MTRDGLYLETDPDETPTLEIACGVPHGPRYDWTPCGACGAVL